MPILVLPPRYTPDSIALWEAAASAGWCVERLHGWRPPDWLKGQEVALYGEPLFAAVVADELGLVLLEPPFNWLADLPEGYRSRTVRFATLAQARDCTQPTFIKPADDKCFAAKVYPSGSGLPADGLLPDATPVLMAEPVQWVVEFRCFVLDRKVEALSPYQRYGELAQTSDGRWPASETERQEALNFAVAVLSDTKVLFPPAVVLDVGIIEGRGWAVIEANAAWGSGIYGCDPAAVLRVVQRACVLKCQLSSADRPWLLARAEVG